MAAVCVALIRLKCIICVQMKTFPLPHPAGIIKSLVTPQHFAAKQFLAAALIRLQSSAGRVFS